MDLALDNLQRLICHENQPTIPLKLTQEFFMFDWLTGSKIRYFPACRPHKNDCVIQTE